MKCGRDNPRNRAYDHRLGKSGVRSGNGKRRCVADMACRASGSGFRSFVNVEDTARGDGQNQCHCHGTNEQTPRRRGSAALQKGTNC